MVVRASQEKPKPAFCRLFFAVFPPPETRQQIATFLHANPALARPVPPQNWHITVLFVGEVDQALCQQLKQLDLADLPAPFVTTLDRCGWWPRPQVGWLAPGQPPEGLIRLHEQVKDSAKELGLEFHERAYKPHVTVWKKLAKPWQCISPPTIDWPVERLHLVRSYLHSTGPQYRSLAQWPLSKRHKN